MKVNIVFVLATLTLLSSCDNRNNDVSQIPVLKNNQTCIMDYLRKIEYFDVENIEVKSLPFTVNGPNEIVGFIGIKPQKNRNMEAMYNGLKMDCYPVLKSTSHLLVDDWSSLSEELNSISKNSQFDNKKLIYLRVDIDNNSYTTYQDGEEIK